MQKLVISLICLVVSATISAQKRSEVTLEFTEACELTMVGKLMDTPNPYHRVDTCRYKGWDSWESLQVRSSAGMAVAFRSDSRIVAVSYKINEERVMASSSPRSTRGVDLYVKEKGGWHLVSPAYLKPEKMEGTITVVANMDRTMKEFLMYLPHYADLEYMKIGTEQGYTIEAVPNPFRHRIIFYGSSFTQGVGTGRAGMSYPLQFERNTGLQAISLGMSGHCKMQESALAVLKDVDADAFIFDTFSNPSASIIRERLMPFIEAMIEAHPGKPLIFQQTIAWETSRYNSVLAERISAQKQTAEQLMAQACRKYKDVYFIHPDAGVSTGESVMDGTHPDNYGYYLWARSIEKPVLKILKKYGIK